MPQNPLRALPTHHEITEATRLILDRGPIPLANFVDEHEHLHAMIRGLSSDDASYELLKTAFVCGLDLGLVIGELRLQYWIISMRMTAQIRQGWLERRMAPEEKSEALDYMRQHREKGNKIIIGTVDGIPIGDTIKWGGATFRVIARSTREEFLACRPFSEGGLEPGPVADVHAPFYWEVDFADAGA